MIRRHGYSGSSVDQLCQAAGVTKGAFFHQFGSKEALGVAAAEFWTETTSAFFATAPYHSHEDPLDRVLGYIEFRKAIIEGELAEFTCLAGTMAQETFATAPEIRDACARSILGHAALLEADIAAAMERHSIRSDWTAASLARHTQAVIQGAFILAKAVNDPAPVRESLDHLRRYIERLFQPPPHGDLR